MDCYHARGLIACVFFVFMYILYGQCCPFERMSIMFLFSLLDRKANSFLKPVPVGSEAEGIRSIQMSLDQPEGLLSRFPEDFAVYEVGFFDIRSGEVTPTKPPRHVVNVSALVKVGGK